MFIILLTLFSLLGCKDTNFCAKKQKQFCFSLGLCYLCKQKPNEKNRIESRRYEKSNTNEPVDSGCRGGFGVYDGMYRFR
jgi:hypothetical protein